MTWEYELVEKAGSTVLPSTTGFSASFGQPNRSLATDRSIFWSFYAGRASGRRRSRIRVRACHTRSTGSSCRQPRWAGPECGHFLW